MAEAKLGRCPRCKAYTLVERGSGVPLAVDIAPVDALGYGVAVASGIRLWWVEVGQNRTSRVLGPPSAARKPSWGPGGRQTSVQKLHQEHSCGAPHGDQVIVSTQQGPQQPSATSGRPGGGSRPPGALAGGTRGQGRPSPATPAIPHRSEPRGRCGVCGRPIHPGAEAWTITHGAEFIYGEHVDCE